MARPERRDADYFPFYCRDGKTLFILEGKYGCKGTGFFTNVMRFLTLQADHHVCIKEDADKLYFFSKVKCDEESGMDMLNLMAATGKIDRCLWGKSRCIASKDLLESLKDAYRQRRNPIITIEQIRVIHGVNELNSDENPTEGELPAGLNHKGKERKGKERKKGFSFSLPEWIPEETWTQFQEMRKKIKKPLTPYASHLIALELESIKRKHGHDPVAVLNESIKNSWQGVFPLKENGNGTGRDYGRGGTGRYAGAEIGQDILDTSERLRRKYESPGNAAETDP